MLFTIVPTPGAPPKVAVLDLVNRTWRTVVEGGGRGRYVDTGHLVYVSGGSLWAVRFDLSRQETVGTAVEVVPRAAMGDVTQFDVSSNGSLVYARGVRQMGVDLRVPTWVARDGRETPLPLAAGSYRHPRLSPTGDRLAIASENGGGDIFLANLTLKNPQLSRLTFRDEEDWMPVWMPTGDGIVFGSRSGGGVSNLFMQRLDDAITVGSTIDLFRGRYLVRDGTHYRQYDVAPAGRFLMLKYQRPTEQGHFVLVQGWTSELQRLVR